MIPRVGPAFGKAMADRRGRADDDSKMAIRKGHPPLSRPKRSWPKRSWATRRWRKQVIESKRAGPLTWSSPLCRRYAIGSVGDLRADAPALVVAAVVVIHVVALVV